MQSFFGPFILRITPSFSGGYSFNKDSSSSSWISSLSNRLLLRVGLAWEEILLSSGDFNFKRIKWLGIILIIIEEVILEVDIMEKLLKKLRQKFKWEVEVSIEILEILLVQFQLKEKFIIQIHFLNKLIIKFLLNYFSEYFYF